MKVMVNLLAVFSLLIGIVACGAGTPETPTASVSSASVIGSGVFVSDTGETIRADYRDNDTVTLTLADGSTRVLTLAVSGSGARYTSGNTEWWEHQGEATYSVDDKPIFVGKLQP